MTESRKGEKKIGRGAPSNLTAFHLEADRCTRGMSLLIGGIIGISDFTDECAVLMSHSGRITVLGKRISICIYENKTVEVSGRVEDIRFTYGKN